MICRDSRTLRERKPPNFITLPRTKQQREAVKKQRKEPRQNNPSEGEREEEGGKTAIKKRTKRNLNKNEPLQCPSLNPEPLPVPEHPALKDIPSLTPEPVKTL